MGIQYIFVSDGEPSGVFIPIDEWARIKEKYKGLSQEPLDIPEWHKHILNERMEEYRTNPKQDQGFDEAIDEIEGDL